MKLIKPFIPVLAVLLAVALFAQAPTDSQTARAQESLNQGVTAFREARYAEAIDMFKTAIALQPGLTNAELYLATAYQLRFIPNVATPQNQEFAANAISGFERVLLREPDNVSAVAGLAGMYQYTNNLTKAREYYLRQSQLDPRNKTPFYAVGSVDWIIVYDKVNPMPALDQTRLADEGLQSLDQALLLDPDFEDAMLYKNLLLREKSRLASDPTEKSSFLIQADAWVAKVLEARRTRMRAPATAAGLPPAGPAGPGGVVNPGVNGANVPGTPTLLTFRAVPPPPPPPPPPPASTRTSPANDRVVVGDDLMSAQLIKKVEPVYPAEARQSRVQGSVVLSIGISRDGLVQSVVPVTGHPLLAPAAIDAVRQWQYRPFALNGNVVEVQTTVTVVFGFQR